MPFIKQYLEIMQNVKSRYPDMPMLLTQLEPCKATDFNPNVIQRDFLKTRIRIRSLLVTKKWLGRGGFGTRRVTNLFVTITLSDNFV